MTMPQPHSDVPGDLLRMLRDNPFRWIVPTILCTLAALGYANTREDTWQASQALVVRNEGSTKASQKRPGEFDRLEEMKAVQETILELARSRTALSNTLNNVGPTAKDLEKAAETGDAWPNEKAIDALRKVVRITPPKGADFGTTEVFYLQVKDNDRQRAQALASDLCGQIKTQYRQLRDIKARSTVDELSRTVASAQSDLDAATERLTKVESEVGSDLGELRILHKSPSGDSDLRRKVSSLDTELRTAEATRRGHEELRGLLLAARNDLNTLVATPNRLLESQPGLRRLKDGLIDAQLATANARSRLTDEHPRVVAAIAAEREVRDHLAAELDIALRGVQSDLRLAAGQIAMLEQQVTETNARLDRLAQVRAEYGKTITEIETFSRRLETAQSSLAVAEASQSAARTASLITLLGSPDTGSRPVSLARSILVVGGFGGGLAMGLGLVLLTARTPTSQVPQHATSFVTSQIEEVHWQEGPETGTLEPIRRDVHQVVTQEEKLSLRQALNKLSMQPPIPAAAPIPAAPATHAAPVAANAAPAAEAAHNAPANPVESASPVESGNTVEEQLTTAFG